MSYDIRYNSTKEALTMKMPINPFTRELELPMQLSWLNSFVSYWQLPIPERGFQYEGSQNQFFCFPWINVNFYGGVSNCTNVIWSETQHTSHECSYTHNFKDDQFNLIKESGKTNKIKVSNSEPWTENKTVRDTDDYELSEIYEMLKESDDKQFALDKYPHEIITKKNETSGKMQKIFICKHQDCLKEFNKSWNLIYHARIHTNEKPFKCTECLESFAQKGNLKRHMKTHSETALWKRKNFLWKICMKKYTTKFNLKIHQQTRHKEDSDNQ